MNINCDKILSVDDNEMEIQIKSIKPQNPTVGDKMKIVLQGLNENYDYSVGHLLYNDELWQGYVDSTNKDTIFTYVPFIYNTTQYNLHFKVRIDTIWYNLATNYIVNNDYLTGINVIDNDEGQINKSHTNKIYFWNVCDWNFEQNEDTVNVWQQYPIHDEAYAILSLQFLENSKNGLPKFLSFIKTHHDSYGGSESWVVRDTLKQGIIKIEDWNENGVYSGKVYAPLEPFEERYFLPPKTVFHCNKNN